MKLRNLGLACAVICVAATGAYGLARGILQPQMKPEKGSYDQPFGQLGQKPATPWTQSTVAAAVDGKPLKGKVVTVVGEIIDVSCYNQVGKHGEGHRDCGQRCLRNGQPIGLLAQDGTVYVLMEEEHNPRRDAETNFREAAIEHMARVMEVTGTLTNVGGVKTIYVQGFLKR